MAATRNYQGQSFHSPVQAQGDPYSNSNICLSQTAFPFSSANFEILQSNDLTNLSSWALAFLSGDLGYFISVFPEFMSPFLGKPEKLSTTQWTTLVVFLAIGLILFGLSFLFPGKKGKLIRKIERHFEINPPSFRVES